MLLIEQLMIQRRCKSTPFLHSQPIKGDRNITSEIALNVKVVQ